MAADKTKPAKGPSGQTSPSTDRTLDVCEALVASAHPLTLTALAGRAELPVATCAAILNTLEVRGYASRTVSGRSHHWSPTLRLYSLGAAVLRRFDLAAHVQPLLQQLSDAVQAPAHLGILNDTAIVYVAKAATTDMVQFNTYPGKMAAFNITALGRAIVAFLPAEVQQAIIDRALGDGDVAAIKGLQEELRHVRVNGYAVEEEEEEVGIGCVAAPILDPQKGPIAAVGVTGLVTTLLGEHREDVIVAVCRAAQEVTVSLGLQ